MQQWCTDLLQQGQTFAFIPLFYSTVTTDNQSASRMLFGGSKKVLIILAGFCSKRFAVNFRYITSHFELQLCLLEMNFECLAFLLMFLRVPILNLYVGTVKSEKSTSGCP